VIDEAKPEDADLLIRGVGILVDHDRKNLARKVLIRAEQLSPVSTDRPLLAHYTEAQSRQVEGYLERARLVQMANGWHKLEDDKKAEEDLERTLDIARQSIKNTPPTILRAPGALASAFHDVAANEAEWGLTERATKTLARMREESPTLTPEDAAAWQILAWQQGKRPDLALAAAEHVPDHTDSLIERYLTPPPPPATDLAPYAAAAARIHGAWGSAQAYAGLASFAAQDHPDEARHILESGIAAFSKTSDDRREPLVFNEDPVTALARPWFALKDPAQALKTLELRAKRPDLFPATAPPPIDDYTVRAEAFVRMGRIDEALKVAADATAHFPTKPVVVRPFERSDVVVEGPRSIIDRPDGALNAGDSVYRTILEALAHMGKPEDVRAVAARFPVRAYASAVDMLVIQADLAAKRWNDAATAVRALPVKDWPAFIGRVAVTLAQNGEDKMALETASLLSDPHSRPSPADVLMHIAKVQTKAGRKSAALAIWQLPAFNAGNSPYKRPELALAQAAVGDFDGAWSTLKKTDPLLPETSEDTIIAEQAKAGDCPRALSEATAMPTRAAWIAGLIAVASVCWSPT